MTNCTYCGESYTESTSRNRPVTPPITINDSGNRSRTICNGCLIEIYDQFFITKGEEANGQRKINRSTKKA